jgi:hypothetical protein
VFSKTFSLSGIAFGTIVAVGAYHMARALAPAHLKSSVGMTLDSTDTWKSDDDVR